MLENVIYEMVDLPTCDCCGGKPLDKKYKEAGNEIAKAPLIVGLTFGAGFANMWWDGSVTVLRSALKKAGKDKHADEISGLTATEAVGEYLDKNFSEDVEWEEKENGDHYCYLCK